MWKEDRSGTPPVSTASAAHYSPRFRRVKVTMDQQLALDGLINAFENAERVIQNVCRDGRLKAMAISYLEVASMCAVKSYTHETLEPEE